MKKPTISSKDPQLKRTIDKIYDDINSVSKKIEEPKTVEKAITADKLKNVEIDDSQKGSGKVLVYNAGSNKFRYQEQTGGSGDLTAVVAGIGLTGTTLSGPIPTLNIDSTVATLAGSQTLTNKTLTTAVLGSSTATTQSDDDNSTKVATTAYVDSMVGGVSDATQIVANDTAPTSALTGDTKIHIDPDDGRLYYMNDDSSKIWWLDAGSNYVSLAFAIASFSDGISDTSQLIGSGTWKAIGAVTFTASYNNAPGGLTATVALSGASNSWGSNLTLASATGATVTTEVVNYPSSATGTITFTLTPSAGGSDTESVSFKNTIRRGNSTLTIGNQDDASIQGLAEESGPDETVTTNTFNNLPTTANYLVFAYASRLAQVKQVRGNFGEGQITCAFNSTRTTVQPTYQTSGLTAVENSAGFEEAFECITSKDTGLANGSYDFYFYNSTSTAQNYIWYGVSTVSGTYSEANVEALGTNTASNTKGRTFTEAPASTYYIVYALPTRLGTVTFTVGGFEGGFEAPQTLTIINEGGFQENYYIYRSTNHSLGSTVVVVA